MNRYSHVAIHVDHNIYIYTHVYVRACIPQHMLGNDALIVPHLLEAWSVVLYLCRGASLHSFVVLVTIEGQIEDHLLTF